MEFSRRDPCDSSRTGPPRRWCSATCRWDHDRAAVTRTMLTNQLDRVRRWTWSRSRHRVDSSSYNTFEEPRPRWRDSTGQPVHVDTDRRNQPGGTAAARHPQPLPTGMDVGAQRRVQLRTHEIGSSPDALVTLTTTASTRRQRRRSPADGKRSRSWRSTTSVRQLVPHPLRCVARRHRRLRWGHDPPATTSRSGRARHDGGLHPA